MAEEHKLEHIRVAPSDDGTRLIYNFATDTTVYEVRLDHHESLMLVGAIIGNLVTLKVLEEEGTSHEDTAG